MIRPEYEIMIFCLTIVCGNQEEKYEKQSGCVEIEGLWPKLLLLLQISCPEGSVTLSVCKRVRNGLVSWQPENCLWHPAPALMALTGVMFL